jgi:hypothetical protein
VLPIFIQVLAFERRHRRRKKSGWGARFTLLLHWLTATSLSTICLVGFH